MTRLKDPNRLKTIRISALLIGCLFLCTTVWAKPDFPPPDEASVDKVGDAMVVNGIATEIRSFYTKKSTEKVADFYHKEWKKGDEGRTPGYTDTDAMVPWRLITRIEDGYLMTVQFQEADQGGSWGYLAMSPLPDKDMDKIELGKNVPLMNDSSVIREIEHDDPGKKARTLLVSNSHSVSSNINYYRNYYIDKGWSVETDYELTRGVMHSLVFKSNRKEINMMFIGDHNETRIVINSVTHTIF